MLIDTHAEHAGIESLRVYVAFRKLAASDICGEFDGMQMLHRALPARER
jgi:hypothetical protein